MGELLALALFMLGKYIDVQRVKSGKTDADCRKKGANIGVATTLTVGIVLAVIVEFTFNLHDFFSVHIWSRTGAINIPFSAFFENRIVIVIVVVLVVIVMALTIKEKKMDMMNIAFVLIMIPTFVEGLFPQLSTTGFAYASGYVSIYIPFLLMIYLVSKSLAIVYLSAMQNRQ